MKANKILLGLALSLSALTACSGGQSEQSAQDSTALPSSSVVANPDSLPYRIAENYFAAEDSLPATLTSEEELNRHLGMATTMADKPTEIDWQREFVIPRRPPRYDDLHGDPPRTPEEGCGGQPRPHLQGAAWRRPEDR